MSGHVLAIDLALILVLGVSAQWVAWRFNLPAILLLLLGGLAAGPGAALVGAGPLLDPDTLFGDLLPPLTSLAVGVILYEGGLSLRLDELEGAGRQVRNLVTLGALVTWLGASAAAWGLGLLDGPLALLLGAILVVTGPTVIGPVLRQVRPHGAAGAVLKWEGIVIDPIGASLAVLVFEVLLASTLREGIAQVALGLLAVAVVGLGLGGLAAGLLILLFRRHWLPEHLENPVSLMVMVASVCASNWIQEESGLLTATVLGVVVGNVLREQARPIAEFKENLQVLLIGGLFVVLSARLQAADLVAALDWRALVFVVLLVLVVRPLAVAASTLRSSLSREERVFLACLAPRGIVAAAVASVFALRLSELGRPEAEALAPLTFLTIIGTVCVYGLGAGPAARRLGLAELHPQGLLILGAHPFARQLGRVLTDLGVTVRLIDSNRDNVSRARLEGLDAVYANVLSQYVDEELDLAGLGRFLALTPNDAVNTLAAQRFLDEFGRAEVYTLHPLRAGSHRHDTARRHRAREVFGAGLGFEVLQERLRSGSAVRATPLSEAFGLREWRARYGEQAVPLALLHPGGGLALFAADAELEPRSGDTLIGLVESRSVSAEELLPVQADS